MNYRLDIHDVTMTFGKATVLDHINLTLENGIYSLLGPNGAGKTTLQNIITGLQKPTEGSVSWDGKDIFKLGEEYRRQLGYMPQHIGFYPYFSAWEMMEYFAELKEVNNGKEIINELLQSVNLYNDRNKRIGTFSGGMLRRLGIAVTLLNDPRLIILDEPTAGLDPKERINFREYIKNLSREKIIIMATHIISDIEDISDKTILLKLGKVLAMETTEKLIEGVRENTGNNNAGLEEVYMYFYG